MVKKRRFWTLPPDFCQTYFLKYHHIENSGGADGWATIWNNNCTTWKAQYGPIDQICHGGDTVQIWCNSPKYKNKYNTPFIKKRIALRGLKRLFQCHFCAQKSKIWLSLTLETEFHCVCVNILGYLFLVVLFYVVTMDKL